MLNEAMSGEPKIKMPDFDVEEALLAFEASSSAKSPKWKLVPGSFERTKTMRTLALTR